MWGRAFIAWMTSSLPLSKTRTTVSSMRPRVSNPRRSCLLGLSSSRSSIQVGHVAAWTMSSGLIPCFRADVWTFTWKPRRPGSPRSETFPRVWPGCRAQQSRRQSAATQQLETAWHRDLDAHGLASSKLERRILPRPRQPKLQSALQSLARQRWSPAQSCN